MTTLPSDHTTKGWCKEQESNTTTPTTGIDRRQTSGSGSAALHPWRAARLFGSLEPSFDEEVPTTGHTDLNNAYVKVAHAEHRGVAEQATHHLATGRQPFTKAVRNVTQCLLITDRTRVAQDNAKARSSIKKLSIGITHVNTTKAPSSQIAKDTCAQEPQIQ